MSERELVGRIPDGAFIPLAEGFVFDHEPLKNEELRAFIGDYKRIEPTVVFIDAPENRSTIERLLVSLESRALAAIIEDERKTGDAFSRFIRGDWGHVGVEISPWVPQIWDEIDLLEAQK